MRRGRVDVEEIVLNTGSVHGLCGTSCDDEVLLVDEPFSNRLLDIASTVSFGRRHINTAFDEIVPPKYLLGPQFKCVKQIQVGSVSKRELVLTVFYESFDCLVVIVNARIRYEVVDSTHLHFDFSAYGYLSSYYGISKQAVIFGSGRVR